MKKFLSAIKAKFDNVCQKAAVAAADVAVNIDGSDTTEKIGMVVVAVIIVGLLATAMSQFMPNLFGSILGSAQNKLTGLFG